MSRSTLARPGLLLLAAAMTGGLLAGTAGPAAAAPTAGDKRCVAVSKTIAVKTIKLANGKTVKMLLDKQSVCPAPKAPAKRR